MDDGFGTRPDELDAAAGRFDEAARIAADAAAALRGTLGGLGELGGADEPGRAFAARYDPKATEGVTAVEQEASGVRSLGDGLRATAADYRAADAGGAAGF